MPKDARRVCSWSAMVLILAIAVVYDKNAQWMRFQRNAPANVQVDWMRRQEYLTVVVVVVARLGNFPWSLQVLAAGSRFAGKRHVMARSHRP